MLLSRDGMYSLHVTVTREFDVPEPDTAETVGDVDINERNVSLTVLHRETMRRRVRFLNYGRVKQERHTTQSRNAVRREAGYPPETR